MAAAVKKAATATALEETEEVKRPLKQPINVGPEMHIFDGKRYGPGIVILDPVDFTNEDGEFDAKAFNKLKNALANSAKRAHEHHQRRLGVVAREVGNGVNVRDLAPPPIHAALPDKTGTPEATGNGEDDKSGEDEDEE